MHPQGSDAMKPCSLRLARLQWELADPVTRVQPIDDNTSQESWMELVGFLMDNDDGERHYDITRSALVTQRGVFPVDRAKVDAMVQHGVLKTQETEFGDLETEVVPAK